MKQKATVKRFAETHKMQPQLIHYYIRKGDIQRTYCDCCGADVIDVEQAEEIFRKTGKIK